MIQPEGETPDKDAWEFGRLSYILGAQNNFREHLHLLKLRFKSVEVEWG